MIPFEDQNQKAYVLLLRIEIALREMLKTALEAQFGPSWRKHLPGELLKKIKSSQCEENRPQFDFLRLGPLYYLTFGELLTLLQQKHVRQFADKLGGDSILKQLENIFAPRNALCHSRPVSSVGLRAIETLYAEIENSLTAKGMAQVLSNPDIGLPQLEAAAAILSDLEGILLKLPSLPVSLPIPDAYLNASNQFWWANDALAGFNISCVERAIAALEQYNSLPRGVGSAGTRQNYCETSGLKVMIGIAADELRKAKQ